MNLQEEFVRARREHTISPTEAEMREWDPAMVEHVHRGCLALRQRDSAGIG